jgi:integrase/recombinase XerD
VTAWFNIFPYAAGGKVLKRFFRRAGDIPLRSAEQRVRQFLDEGTGSEVNWRIKYRMLEAFFDYWKARGESVGLAPSSRVRVARRSSVPYIYSVAEVRRLVEAAGRKRKPAPDEFGPETFQNLLVFLYGTGAQITEALELRSADLDFRRATVTIRHAVTNRVRTIPIGSKLCLRLRKYARSTRGRSEHFFTREDGRPIRLVSVSLGFRWVRRKAGISLPTTVHDLRRTFGVHCLRRWLREGRDLNRLLPLLCVYLGHAEWATTQAYLSVMPERFRKSLRYLSL